MQEAENSKKWTKSSVIVDTRGKGFMQKVFKLCTLPKKQTNSPVHATSLDVWVPAQNPEI